MGYLGVHMIVRGVRGPIVCNTVADLGVFSFRSDLLSFALDPRLFFGPNFLGALIGYQGRGCPQTKLAMPTQKRTKQGAIAAAPPVAASGPSSM